jgi:hypothetical protein
MKILSTFSESNIFLLKSTEFHEELCHPDATLSSLLGFREATRKEAIDSGCIAYLRKPFPPQLLL